jgi:glycerophosphoryl diester phosphodiesterase
MSAWETAPLVVGHRGGRGAGWPPENTIEAFEHARGQGAVAVELDVRASADGQAIVFHDPTLARLTGGRDARHVEGLAASELRAVDLDRGAAGARIPSLADALAWARDRGVAVNVELKYDVPRLGDVARAATRAVRDTGADVLFSSFDPRLLAWVAVLAPRVPRAYLTHAGQRRWADAAREVLRPPVVRALHLEEREASPEALERYRRRGFRVGVWTVNDPVAARRLAAGGVGSIITDSPGTILQALRAPAPAADGVTGRS